MKFRVVHSPIKGFWSDYDDSEVDFVESIISPVLNPKPWVTSLANLQESAAFNLAGLPISCNMRVAWLQRLFIQPDCDRWEF